MKSKKYSFLFFCFITVNTFCVFNFNLISQTTKDSTLFYYHSITEIKDKNHTIKAFNFFEKKTEQSMMLHDTINAAYYLELISLGQYKMGFLYECESTTIKAYSLLNAIESNPQVIDSKKRLTNQLGLLYREIEDFDNSYKYYYEALKLNTSFIDKIAIITNIAINYADQNQFKEANESLINYYNEVLTLENSNIKATYLDNLGYFQSKTNSPLMAIKNMELALEIRKELEDLTGLFSSYRHLSLYFSDRGNINEAIDYSNRASIIADALNIPNYKLEAMSLALGFESNPHINEYLELNRSIEKTNKLQENKYAAIKYNVSEKEKLLKKNEYKLEISELEKEKEKNLKYFYLTLGALITLISIFTIIILKSKHKKDKIQEVYLTETRISKKVHDEVANDVYQVMTKLQGNSNSKEEILDDLDNIYARTRDISKENSALDVNDHYENLLNDLLLSYKNSQVNIITRNIPKINWSSIEALKKIMIYRVLQELMVNMKKHSQASNVALTFNQFNSKITISYKDDGVGCKIQKKSGLQNMENRIKSINGSIIFESEINKGFKAKITV